VDDTVEPGRFISRRGSDARAGEALLRGGVALDYSGIGMLAAAGHSRVDVFARPRVAVLPTGDELVALEEQPLDFQIRNSNAYALAAQVRRAGGEPELLAAARDDFDDTHALVDRGLASNLLLVSGGVSAGKYDVVERVLAAFGAEFYFDRVLVQPGQPLVFGRARGTFFFGLPGNPASTMVTFEVLARAALELLGGMREPALRMPLARLTADFRHKPGLTRFLPASLSGDGREVTPVSWQGSGDMPAVARANAWMMVEADRPAWARGELVPVLPK
jgi:molybdopterin molybdotransferase